MLVPGDLPKIERRAALMVERATVGITWFRGTYHHLVNLLIEHIGEQVPGDFGRLSSGGLWWIEFRGTFGCEFRGTLPNRPPRTVHWCSRLVQ